VDIIANHIPHRTRTLMSGKKVVSKVLPTMWIWKESIPEFNTVNSAFGLKDMLLSNLSKIRKLNFPEYDAKKPEDNFARNRLHSLQKATISKSQAAMLWALKLKPHLNGAWAHWKLYHANHHCLRFFPSECVMIMRDNTTSPVFSHKKKQLDGLMKLPVSVTGTLAHGHRDR
jgi:hypothetical protein